uniref:LRAT domain-containing protein n=1 Tax=Panagrolaimus superbus TaxID=310955 RepID=A0A914YT01_9BILA
MSVFEADVPRSFRVYVNEELEKEWMGDEIERSWGKTHLGQYFCFITSKVIWYGVRLIIDEEYRNLEIKRERGVHRVGHGVVIKKDFLTREGATDFVLQNTTKYGNGEFNDYFFRARAVPNDVHENPDMYLKPGDHVQRDLDMLFFSHDGIYLGNGKVAHISGGSSNSASNSSSSSCTCMININDAQEACARIVTLKEFVLSDKQEVRIVVHCFRRKSRTEICEKARELVAERYGYGNYNILSKNCQHFATLCALGEECLTDF